MHSRKLCRPKHNPISLHERAHHCCQSILTRTIGVLHPVFLLPTSEKPLKWSRKHTMKGGGLKLVQVISINMSRQTSIPLIVTQIFRRLIYLYWFRDYFRTISSQSSEQIQFCYLSNDWGEIFMKQAVNKSR